MFSPCILLVAPLFFREGVYRGTLGERERGQSRITRAVLRGTIIIRVSSSEHRLAPDNFANWRRGDVELQFSRDSANTFLTFRADYSNSFPPRGCELESRAASADLACPRAKGESIVNIITRADRTLG